MPTNAVRHILSHTRSSHTRARTHTPNVRLEYACAHINLCARAVFEMNCNVESSETHKIFSFSSSHVRVLYASFCVCVWLCVFKCVLALCE